MKLIRSSLRYVIIHFRFNFDRNPRSPFCVKDWLSIKFLDIQINLKLTIPIITIFNAYINKVFYKQKDKLIINLYI